LSSFRLGRKNLKHGKKKEMKWQIHKKTSFFRQEQDPIFQPFCVSWCLGTQASVQEPRYAEWPQDGPSHIHTV
jgi:hypothetical protein